MTKRQTFEKTIVFILLNERFTKRSFTEKTNEIDDKMNDILRTKKNNFFE